MGFLEAGRAQSSLLLAGLVLLLSPVLALALLENASPLRLDLGPGDRAYVRGFGEWRWEDGDTWRPMSRRAALSLPVTLSGPGRFTLDVRYESGAPGRLRARFDEGKPLELGLAPEDEWRLVSFDLPEDEIRADVRVRFDAATDTGETLHVRAAEWATERPRPSLELLGTTAVLLLGTYAAVLLAAGSLRAALGACLLVSVAVVSFGESQPFSALHLVLASPPPMLAGLLVVGVVRSMQASVSAGVLLLFLLPLTFRSLLLFHPEFHFFDLPIHETLVELLYHRGLVDFWTRWPDYHARYGLGLSVVEGEREPLLYPLLFHSLVHPFNSLLHAPVVWLKLALALLGSLVVFPVAYLARRFSAHPRADVLAAGLYLLVPGLTRSVLLLKFAATLGHLLDLCLVAYLAAISLRLDPRWRWLGATLLIAACLAAYNSGFLNVGLLIGACLLLAPLVGGSTRRQAILLASAGLAGLALGLAFYPPVAVRDFFLSLTTATAEREAPSGSYSIVGMAVDLLGWPLLGVGLAGWLWLPPGPLTSASVRLLLHGWLGSVAAGLALRFLLPEVLLYHKEHYWAGAALAVTGGIALARAARRSHLGLVLAGGGLLAAILVWLFELRQMQGFFYGPYLFE